MGRNDEDAITPEVVTDGGLGRQLQSQEVSEERANRFYDRLRRNISDYLERRGGSAGRFRDYLLIVPDMFFLLWRLTRDSRVARKYKILLASGVAYYIFPLDFVPEIMVGPVGYLDDLLLGAFILNRILGETSTKVLREHWSGRGDVLEMMRRVIGAADFLVQPKIVKRIERFVGARGE